MMIFCPICGSKHYVQEWDTDLDFGRRVVAGFGLALMVFGTLATLHLVGTIDHHVQLRGYISSWDLFRYSRHFRDAALDEPIGSFILPASLWLAGWLVRRAAKRSTFVCDSCKRPLRVRFDRGAVLAIKVGSARKAVSTGSPATK